MLKKAGLATITATAAIAAVCSLGFPAFAADSGGSTDPGTTAPEGSPSAQDDGPIINPLCGDEDGDGFVDDEQCILYASGGMAPLERPGLSQVSSKGVATLSVHLSPDFKGRTIIFFARRADGGVRPLGTAKVALTGDATRVLKLHKGQSLAVYAKALGTSPAQLPNAYSHTVSFTVR